MLMPKLGRMNKLYYLNLQLIDQNYHTYIHTCIHTYIHTYIHTKSKLGITHFAHNYRESSYVASEPKLLKTLARSGI